MNKQPKLYAAYGSNININQMQFRCPSATVFGVGTIPGMQLDFCNVATITVNDKASTPVLLWNLSKDDEAVLDKFEGVPHKYHK